MAKKIMIQGTMSNVGKSFIAAGLCRIFKQDGYKTAPFKSQNMALNSYITREGLEMGRAQVIQAEAAKIQPSVKMNPILLKPTNDVGSQVIVNGEVLGNMSAREYFAYKKNLIPQIMEAFHELEKDFDIIVMEGAGSPAEINLKEDDIVNMGMAKLVDAPVLLVGDIDRGGVFAQLIGTVDLLEEEERQRIKGLIINKFRGDKSILDPGVVMLEGKSGIKVVGVTPYMNVDIEEEDSLTTRFERDQKAQLIDIVVIRLPRISNFTDFHIFETIEGVSLRYVSKEKDFGNPDMVILPGTKSTISDLHFLRESGLEVLVLKAYHAGKVIFGICGGYQMLGNTITDREGIEAEESIKGLGLLDIDTIFEDEKMRTRVTGEFQHLSGVLSGLSKLTYEGYEIHMGRTKKAADVSELGSITDSIKKQTALDGASCGNVYGSYVHGIFDRKEVSMGIVAALCKEKGIALELAGSMDMADYKEREYDKLADILREHLDIQAIYKMLEEQDDTNL
jgi:adenosylcobyric acid synthase